VCRVSTKDQTPIEKRFPGRTFDENMNFSDLERLFTLEQEFPNIFVRGPHKLLHNNWRAGHELPVQKNGKTWMLYDAKSAFVKKNDEIASLILA